MQEKQNPAARLRGAEVHLSARDDAAEPGSTRATCGLREGAGVIVTARIDNQNLARAAADAGETAGKGGGLVRYRDDNRNLWRVVCRHFVLNLSNGPARRLRRGIRPRSGVGLTTERSGHVGPGRRSEFESRRRDRGPRLITVERDDMIAVGLDHFGPLDLEVGVHPDVESFEEAFERRIARGELQFVAGTLPARS